MVIGPGLGRDEGTVSQTRRVIAEAQVPMVIDGDGLFAVAWGGDGRAVLFAIVLLKLF